jgi:toxin-antitoxin system PIN domain toxin
MFLPDVNFWLALGFQSHQHHGSAKAWMQSAPLRSCCMCRVTQMAFLRLATNPKVLPNDVLALPDAWRAYDEMISDERVVFAEEPAELELAWRSFTRRKAFSTNIWTDAYLAAFAQAAGFELVTFDRGLAQYRPLRCTILS